MMRTRQAAALLMLAFALAAPAAAREILRIHGMTLTVEVASTPQERRKGLMFRKSLPPDRGMLFVFPDEAVRYFWMKYTVIPLDIAFLDGAGKLIVVKTMKPLDTTLVSSRKPARFALETDAGVLSKMRLKTGEKILRPPRQTGAP